MRISQRLVAVVLFAVASLAGVSSPARAADGSALTIGSGMALSILIPDTGDNLTVFSAPEGSPFLATSPGLRFGHVSASRGFEFGLGAGIQYIDPGSGESFHVMVFGLDLQKHFVSQASWNLYLGGDVGISTSEFFAEVTQPYFGVMVGGRNVISDDNGTVKLALHLRHHLEDDEVGADSFNEIAFAMHFDLWIPK
jgi:hypothetical protein